MAGEVVIWDEQAALTGLRRFLLRCLAPPHGPVAATAVYRGRPPANASARGLASYFLPSTAAPVDESWQGEQSVAAQRQRVRARVAATPVVPGVTYALRVLGVTTPGYVALPGDTPADVVAALLADLAALGVAATYQADPDDPAALLVLGDVAGVSMGVLSTGDLGSLTLTMVDDDRRAASYDWGRWTVRVVVQDIRAADGSYRSTALAEKVRRFLMAESIPETPGLAYPTLRDRLEQAGLFFLACAPLSAPLDVVEDDVWVRRAALDVVFQVRVGVSYDLPSLDAVGMQPPVITDP